MNTTTKTIASGIGGAVVAVLIVLGYGNITANNYPNSVLEHLVDIVQGNKTTTAIATNVPAWSWGEPLPAPVANAVLTATSTGGDLASSTPFYFKIAALDGAGTSTPSNIVSVTTNASTTGGFSPGPQKATVTFSAVPGATGYAIFSSTDGTNFNLYDIATTTGAFTLATTSTSKTGSDNLTVGTAFGLSLSQNGPSYINSAATGTSSPVASTTGLQIGGTIAPTAAATTTACESDTAGSIFFNQSNGHEWGCTGSAWTKVF